MTLMLLTSTVLTWRVGDQIRILVSSQIEVLTAAERVDHYGTVLQMSVNAVVATGDAAAAARYRVMQPQLRATLTDLRSAIRGGSNRTAAAEVDHADLLLTTMEYEALELVSMGKLGQARNLIHSSKYDHLTKVYFEGIRGIEERAASYIDATHDKLDLYFWLVIALSAASLVLVILGWFALIRPTRKWGNELESARASAEFAARRLNDNQVELESLNRKLFDQARTDPLTGLHTRLKFNEDIEQLWPKVERYSESYCALMCDVDFFKQYNDTFGHLAGDRILQNVAGALRSVLRAGDQLYRFGGEEFLMILHACAFAGAKTAAEQFRAAVEELNIAHSGSPLGMVTVSIGISCMEAGSRMTLQAWLNEADEAMYEAKAGGRNAVVIAEKSAA